MLASKPSMDSNQIDPDFGNPQFRQNAACSRVADPAVAREAEGFGGVLSRGFDPAQWRDRPRLAARGTFNPSARPLIAFSRITGHDAGPVAMDGLTSRAGRNGWAPTYAEARQSTAPFIGSSGFGTRS